jgi:outer membrane lipoprotein-sorting protein
MGMLTTFPALRWTVPAVAAAAVIGGGAAVGTLTASADPDLPPRNAAQLLVDLQTARLDGLSGTVVQRADLGLPNLPVQGGGDSSDLSSLISGKHTLRVWYAGPDQARVALLGRLGESDIIRNKHDVWIWSSRDNTYAHKQVSESEQDAKSRGATSQLPFTPQQAADAALAAIDPSTVVSTAGSAKVAGRDAYEVVLAPRDSASLVGQVRFAIDAEEHVPLRVQVYAKGATDPAVEVAFTEINFDRPDAEQFAFKPPAGAKEEQIQGFGTPLTRLVTPTAGKAIGSGWTTVLVGPSPIQSAGRSGSQVNGMLQMLPRVSGSWGSGRLLAGKLFSVLITDDNRVLAGLVSPDRLYQVAADPAAKVKTR